MAIRYQWRWATVAALAASTAITACSGGGASSSDGNSAPVAGVKKNIYGGEMYAAGSPVDGGTLKVGIATPVPSLDPSIPIGSSSTGTDEAIYGKLMTLDGSGKPVPRLAKSLTTTDNGTAWKLTLPAGAKFSDGTPFDSQAVRTYLSRLALPTSQSLQAGSVRQIKSMSTPDAQTLVMTLKAANAGFATVFTNGSPSMVPSPTAVRKEGSQFGLKPVGAGPFKVKSFQPNGTLDVVRNPTYPGTAAHVDEIQYIPTPDDSARLQAVRSGSLDVGPIGTAADYATARGDGLKVLKQPSYNYYGLLLNLTVAPFNDLRFRTAVVEAVNLQGLSTAAFGGSETPTSGLVSPANPYYKKVDWPTYNLSDAKNLVGQYTAATGKSASFSLVVPNPPAFSKLAAVLQQMLKQAGITMKYSVATPQTMVTSVGAGTYQAQMRPEGISLDMRASVTDEFASNSAYNQGLAGDPALDALIEKSRTASGDELTAIYGQMQDELAKWRPQIPLVTQGYGFYIGSRVGGFPGGSFEQRPAVDLFDPTAVWLTK